MDQAKYWDSAYQTKQATEVSWYQPDPQVSVDLINALPQKPEGIIDVGGGASLLVDRLLGGGFQNLAVLDISQVAVEAARRRLGERAAQVRWIIADITSKQDLGCFGVWHDRAVFHFLTAAEDRRRYVELAKQTVTVGGHLIISTFALTGPSQCSGLPVCRYDASTLAAELGGAFTLLRQLPESHRTPSGKMQDFIYTLFRRP